MTVPLLKPWVRMTPEEQAHHLVHDHGFDHEYFGFGATAQFVPDKDAVERAFLEPCITEEMADDASFPHPDGRADWHEGDHQDNEYGGAFAHRHIPESQQATIPDGQRFHNDSQEG